MDLRSGTFTEVAKTKERKDKRGQQQTIRMENVEKDAGKSLERLMLSIKDDIAAQIKDFRLDFQQRSDETKEELQNLRTEMREMQTAINSANENILAVEQRVNKLEENEMINARALTHLLQQEKHMVEKMEYLENKSRQNNIRIHQVKEGVEGSDMVKFLKILISEKLEIPAAELDIVAAHRAFQRKPTQNGSAPRSIIAKFLTWDTRQRVIHTAWAKRTISYEDSRIFFDQDYSSKIQKERSLYAPIRKELREKGVKSHIIYPSKLKVFHNEGSQTYNSAREAAAALHARGITSGVQHLQGDQGARAQAGDAPAAISFEERRRQRGEYKTAEDLLKELRGTRKR